MRAGYDCDFSKLEATESSFGANNLHHFIDTICFMATEKSMVFIPMDYFKQLI